MFGFLYVDSIYIIEQYSLRPNRLLAIEDSILDESSPRALLGVEGLDDEDLDGGLWEDLVVDAFVLLLLDFADELADGLFLALVGLTGVLNSCLDLSSVSTPSVKLSSLIGE